MIKTKKDLRFYIEEDRKRNGVSRSWGGYFFKLIAGHEKECVYRYLKCLRHYEYHLNNSHGSLYHKLMCLYYKFKHLRLGLKYNIQIGPNKCGYGLRINHIVGGGGHFVEYRKSRELL